METALKTAPTLEVITLDQAKRHLNIELEDTYHDDYISQSLIPTARSYIENLCWRKFITQSWYAYLDDWPKGDYIELPYGNLQSVTTIKYTDTDNSQSTWSSAEYIVGTNYERGRVTLEDGYTWPNVVLYPSSPIEIDFTCGYGSTRADVPECLKQAIKIVISELFENRESSIIGMGTYTELPTVMNLISDERLNEL